MNTEDAKWGGFNCILNFRTSLLQKLTGYSLNSCPDLSDSAFSYITLPTLPPPPINGVMWRVLASGIWAEVIDAICQAWLIIHYSLFPHSQSAWRGIWASRGRRCPKIDRVWVCKWSTHEVANQREHSLPPAIWVSYVIWWSHWRLGVYPLQERYSCSFQVFHKNDSNGLTYHVLRCSLSLSRSTFLTSLLLFWAHKQTVHSKCQKLTCG